MTGLNIYSKVTWSCVTLFFLACLVVYVKDLNRRLLMDYQVLEKMHTELMIQWGRLLLEQSAWSSQARIQQIAQQRLEMVVPESPKTLTLSQVRVSES